MPVGLRITGTSATGELRGTAKPGATVQVENLSASPFGPLDQDELVAEVRADHKGHFSCKVPLAREGDVVRVQGGKRSWLNVRISGMADKDGRRAECDLQGIRLVVGARGSVGFRNVRKTHRVGEPGAQIRFVNTRTGDIVDLELDDHGRLPKGRPLHGEPGDRFEIRVSDGVHNADFADVWTHLIVPHDGAPPATADEHGTQIADYTGPLFVSGVDADDPLQGALGDCWLVATVSAVALCEPERIEKMIQDNGDGTCTVRFQRWKPETKRYVQEPVVVTGELHSRRSGPVYGRSRGAHGRETMEMWWPLLEKAYAKWKGGYDAASCGYWTAAFEALLGREGRNVDFTDKSPDEVYELLKKASDDDAPVILCSNADPTLEDKGLVPDHAFTLLGCIERDGQRLLRIRNPWGEFEPRGNGKNDGIFELTPEKLLEFFCFAGIASK